MLISKVDIESLSSSLQVLLDSWRKLCLILHQNERKYSLHFIKKGNNISCPKQWGKQNSLEMKVSAHFNNQRAHPVRTTHNYTIPIRHTNFECCPRNPYRKRWFIRSVVSALVYSAIPGFGWAFLRCGSWWKGQVTSLKSCFPELEVK